MIRSAVDVLESSYCFPALASALSGFTPFELRNLMLNHEPDDEPVVRSVLINGSRRVHLGDVLLLARARAEGSPV